MRWNEVLDNAEGQRRDAVDCARRHPGAIDAFYPELHDEQIGGKFVDVSGALLLGDVLTAPCVLVDLYSHHTPDRLINDYGVDFDFLIKLRDQEAVVICANQLPDAYEKCYWMYDILADSRTIFRSLRTPEYFKSQKADFHEIRKELESQFLFHILRRSDSEINRLSDLLMAAQRPDSPQRLAYIMSLWATQVATVERETGNQLISALLASPEDNILSLRQWRLCTVAPDSSGLGGTMRIPREKLLTYFPQTLTQAEVSLDEWVKVTDLSNYLITKRLKATNIDLTDENFWHGITEYRKQEILSHIANKEQRNRGMMVEREMRLSMAKAGREGWSIAEIDHYVNELEITIQNLKSFADLGFWLGALGFWLAGNRYVAVAGIGTRILGNRTIGQMTDKIIEFCIPKIQIVNFFKS